ncbi:MAG: FtsQ-type POTRA domain-containing protein [Anaerolineaceae bacterium]
MAQKHENMSRADQVRARRQIEPVRRKPIPKPSQKSTRNEESSAHVTTRRADSGMARPSQTSYTQYRRKVYVPTSTPGSEIRLPSIPNIKLGWRIVSGILVALAAVGLYMMKSSDMFEVSSVNLSGAQRISAEEITGKLNVTGKSIIEVIPSEVEGQILADFPDIKQVEVQVELPASFNIIIEERIPAVTWFDGDTASYWIDEQGFAFPIRGEATIPMAVHANGEPPRPLGYVDPAAATLTGDEATIPSSAGPSVDPDFVTTVLKLRNVIPAGTNLLYDQENGLGWLDPHGWQVYFGISTTQIDLKLAEYDKIVETILDKNLQPVLISLEFLHAPYYRLEQ